MNTEEWKPKEEDIEWTIGHLNSINIGGVWAPGGSGLEYEKTGNTTLALKRIVQHPESGEMHRRILMTLEDTDWAVIEEEAEMVLPPLNPQEAQFQQLLRQQEIASQWGCPNTDCGEKIVDMPLEEAEWISEGMQAALDENNEAMEIERWRVGLICGECHTQFQIDPQDYGLLGGDDLFFRWNTPHGIYTVLTREQVVEMVDAGIHDDVCVPLGSQREDSPVPPHMRGTYCLYAPNTEEEE